MTFSPFKKIVIVSIIFERPLYEISAGGDIEVPQGYYTYEGYLMIYNACTWYVTFG